MSEEKDSPQFDEELLSQILEQLIPEAREIIDHLNLCLIQLDQNPRDETLTETIKRGFHTMKGSSGFAGLDQLSRIAKAFEFLMADAMKGDIALTATAVHLMYEGLDAIAEIIDKAEAGDMSQIDAAPLLEKVERFKSGGPISAAEPPESEPGQDAGPGEPAPSSGPEDLLKVYQDAYRQMAALKQVVFASIGLKDCESMAADLSRQIHTHLKPPHNSVWFVSGTESFIEIARDGTFVEKERRRVIPRDISEDFQRVMIEQLMIWPSDTKIIGEVLTEYRAPVIFPIQADAAVLGLLILDPVPQEELEVYPFVAQFAAMMISIAELHRKVDEQRVALDEMAGVLYRQNKQLSAFYQVEMELLGQKDPVVRCRMVAEALIRELEIRGTAVFLHQPNDNAFVCVACAGGLEAVAGSRFDLGEIPVLDRTLETGGMVVPDNAAEPLLIGTERVDRWLALGIKGREKVHGVIVLDLGPEELGDTVSVIVHYLGVILDDFRPA